MKIYELNNAKKLQDLLKILGFLLYININNKIYHKAVEHKLVEK